MTGFLPEVQTCTYSDLARLGIVLAASRDGMAMAETRNTVWFRAGEIACCGLYLGCTPPRWKAVWVDPAFRKLGLSRRLLEAAVAVAKHHDHKAVQAIAESPYVYHLGFALVRKDHRGKDVVRLVWE